MDDEIFKELVINYLNGIYLNLRYMNSNIPKDEYEYCTDAADNAILRLLEKTRGVE